MRQHIATGSITFILLSLTACGEVAPQAGDDTTTVSSELSSEQTGVVEYMYRQYRKLAGVALASYAAPEIGGCGASMIGPNIMITAAHCGFATQINFRTYPEGGAGGPNVVTTSTYGCQSLVHSFGDSDINIHYCAPGADGVNPGDRYGYLDVEARRPNVGDQLYSPWTNQQPTAGVPVALMYSPGKVTRNNLSESELWSVPGNAGAIGIQSDVYAEAGASGSPQLSAVTNRILVGPLSTAFSSGGRSRSAVSMYDYLYWGRADSTGSPPAVNDAAVRSLALDPQNYFGWLDDELDWLFDIQSDLERARGEAQRDWYELGFRSPRKNKLWDPVGSLARFTGTSAIVTRTDSAAGPALRHPRLNLVNGGKYVLSGLLRRTSGTGDIWLGLRSDAGGYSGNWLGAQAGIPFAIPVTATGPNSELLVYTSSNATFEILELTLARSEGSIRMKFDDGDQRKLWTDAGEFPGPAFIVPDGFPVTPNVANWGLYVPTSASRLYTAQFDRIPIATGKTYQICFDTRRDSGTATSRGRVNVRGGQTDLPISFSVNDQWLTICNSFSPVGSVTAQFGVESGPPYRVDNLRFVALP